MRLWLISLFLLSGAACGWFASVTDPANESAGTPDADAGPTCAPVIPKGPGPWAKGDTLGAGWTITEVDEDHVEYARYKLAKGDDTTGLELRYHDEEPGDWATERTRLMPAPEEEPPQALLEAAIASLRAHDAQHADGAAFLRRSEGVDSKYEGLPPCEE